MFDKSGSTRLYNTLMGNPNAYVAKTNSVGRYAGSGSGDNFFTKKAKSIENALGTTGAAFASFAKDTAENLATDQLRRDNKNSMNDIAKKYGYNSWSDWQDAYYTAKDAGDTAKVAEMEPQLKEFQAQANTNAAKTEQKANDYKDYRENNYISQKINQDRGKFAGSAINTMSTATDVLGLTNGPLSNAIQGGIEGVADELEQNGFENFDWQRAGQNALTGAAAGAATGALNNTGFMKNLGQGKISQAVMNSKLGQKVLNNGVGNALRTVGTGAARGAISGAVGGATGAGLSAAMNNQDVLGSALQGAVQGAKSGATTGAIMTSANMAINKTPGVGKFLRDVNQAQQDWKNSGSNFDERLTNTLTSGDSPIGEWVQGNKQSGALSRLRNMGGTLQDTSALVDNTGRAIPTEIAERLANIDPRLLDKNGNIKVMYHGTPNGGFERFDDGSYFTEDKTYADGYQNPSASSLMPKTEAKNPMTYDTYIDAKRLFDINDSDARKIYIDDYVKGGNSNSINPYRSNYDDIRNIDWTEVENLREFLSNNPQYGYDGIIADEGGIPNDEGGVTYRGQSIIPMSGDQVIMRGGANQQQTPTTLGGWLKKAGQRVVEDANNRGVGMSVKDVSNDVPDDIRNMQIRDYNANADGGTDTTYGIASDPRVRQQLLANVNAQLAENPNARIGDTNFDADAIISEYSDRLTPEQYRNFNPTDAENALVQELQGLEAGQGFSRPNSRQITQATQVDPWDRLAQQNGYRNYDEVIQRYMEANPNAKINPRGMAGAITTWMDNNPGDNPTTVGGWAKKAGQRIVDSMNNRGMGLSVKDLSNNDQGYPNDIKNLKINQNDMLGYTDDNAEPITVEEALNRAGVNPSQRGTTQTMAEEVETRTTTKNPQTELYETLKTEKSSTENRLRNAAGLKLQEQYGTIDKPTAKATNAPETLQKIAKAGFTKPADVERMANAITGSNGEVSKLVANLVATAKPVNTFDGETSGQSLNDYIDLAIQKRGLDGISEGKAVKSQINALMKSLPSHAEGSISYVDDPTDTFKMTQLLDSEAANYEGRSGMNYGTTTPDKLRAAQVIKDVSGLLKDRIYETVDVKQALTPEVAENLKAYAPNNKEWADYVDDEIMTANSVKDLRSVQAPWVRANKIIDNGYMNSVTYGGRNGGNGAIPLTKKGLIGLALDATVNSKPGLRAQAKVLNKAADIAASKAQGGESVDNAPNVKAENIPNTKTETPTNNVAPTTTSSEAYNPSMNIYNAIGRNEGRDNAQQARTADYLVNAAQEAEVVNDNTGVGTTMNPQSTSLYNALYGQTSETAQAQPTTSSTGYFQPTGDYWTDILASAMSKAIDADDVEAFAALYGMYQDQLSNISKNTEKDYSNPVNWNSTDRKSLLQAQNGLDQIDSLENSYNDAVGSGGSNLIQGTLRQWSNNISGGNLDPSAENYVKQANSIGAGIIKNLVNLGSTEYDAQRYIDYLPKLTDTKEQAAQKLQVLRNAYENVIQNLRDVYSA